MNRTQKNDFVERFTQEIGGAPFVALMDYRGASVAESADLRRKLEKSGLKIEVVKNTLAKRAIAGTDKEPLGELFNGMTSVVLSGEDPIACAKIIKDVIDPKGSITVKGGYFEGTVLDPDGVKAVASLPGREELLATLLSTILAAPRQVMGVIRAPARDLLYLLKNYEDKLAKEQGGE